MNDIPETLNAIDVLVGAKVREGRLNLGLTGDHVASKLGVDTGTLEQMEEGRIRISAVQLQTLCALLRLSPASIFDTKAIGG